MALPGEIRKCVSSKETCDHGDCEMLATHKVCIESDSFGDEWAYYCDEHLSQYMSRDDEPVIGDCDWCTAVDVPLSPRRDVDEGSHGPVYMVCDACIRKDEAQLEKELEQYDDY